MAIEDQESVQEPSLRDSLEAAIEKVETPAQEPANTPAKAEGTEQPADDEPAEGHVVDLNKPTDAAKLDKQVSTPATGVEDAPKSWKAAARGKWSTVDPEIRTEVQRREKEIARVFGETSTIREQAKQLEAVLRPFEARIQSTGMPPLQVVQELFRADHILTTAPAPQRAAYMAKLIKDYGVDIRALDSALAGEQIEDPASAQFAKMLDERLSPLQAFISQQQQIAQGQEQQILADASAAINAIATDNVKYPHYESVRQDMADIIEMNSRRNVYLTPEQAYTRAVAMNPEWGAQAAQQVSNGRQLQQARSQNDRAQRALNASSSTSGAPGGSP